MMFNEIIRYFPVPVGNPNFNIHMVGVSHFDKTYKINRANSGFYNCEIIISGSGTVEFGGKTHTVTKGDVYILPPGMAHSYFSSPYDPWIKMFFCVSGSLAENLMREYDLSGAHIVHAPGLYGVFRDFFNHSFNKSVPIRETTRGGALIFHRFVQELSESIPHGNSTPGQQLKEYIEQNSDKSLTVTDMAEHICRSPSQTIRIFRKEFGTTPYEYYLEKRIELACNILCSSNISVKGVSDMLGFPDESYFSKVFSKKMGISPGKYKNKSFETEK